MTKSACNQTSNSKWLNWLTYYIHCKYFPFQDYRFWNLYCGYKYLQCIQNTYLDESNKIPRWVKRGKSIICVEFTKYTPSLAFFCYQLFRIIRYIFRVLGENLKVRMDKTQLFQRFESPATSKSFNIVFIHIDLK